MVLLSDELVKELTHTHTPHLVREEEVRKEREGRSRLQGALNAKQQYPELLLLNRCFN